MKRREFLVGGLSLIFSGCHKEAHGETPQKPHPFKLEDVNPSSKTCRSQLGPQNYQKGLLLINFAAIWCGPCRTEFPHFEEVYKNGGISLLVVNTDDDYPWKNMKELEDYTYPFLFHKKLAEEKGSDVARKYHIRILPTTYVIKDSEIKKVKEGAFSKKELEELVEKYK